MNDFIQKLLSAAKEAGLEAAEVYFAQDDDFRIRVEKGELSDYTSTASCGISLRGLKDGKMGYAYSQAFDDEAVSMLVNGVLESAALVEDDSVQEIYAGDGEYPSVDNFNPALEEVTEAQKIETALEAEKQALATDERIAAVPYDMLSSGSSAVRIVNSYGLDVSARDNYAYLFLNALARDGEKVASAGKISITRDFDALDPQKTAQEAAQEALFMLNAEPVQSGTYRVIMDRYAMSSLLDVFSSVFSAEEAQQGVSLLQGKEGETIASDVVTLVDDPLLPGGLESRGFDDEGVKSRTKMIIEEGKLNTLLHNLKTARKAGVASTGNAKKASYSAPVRVAPTNFFFKPGTKTLEELMQDMGNGIVITDLSGLHAGANQASGDFSLLAEGYTVENGKKAAPVDRITVAGNFYALLKSIRSVGSDLVFPGSGVGSPSVDVGEMNIAGK